ncbi:MAG: hypothetical protein ABI345_07535 [Jatrophihabitans sp.]
MWAILGFIFACYILVDLVKGHLIDVPVSLAIVVIAAWRIWRNLKVLQPLQ